MTNWQPDLETLSGPRYMAIAEALAHDIGEGALKAGERLPTHRDLAWSLGVTIGTVSRAYAEAERRGLISGEVGRGTFVRYPASQEKLLINRDEALGDDVKGEILMNFSFPPYCGEDRFYRPVLESIAADPDLPELFGYQRLSGLHRHRAAGAAWLRRTGLEVDPDHMVITAGAQNAIAVALAAMTQPGDRILCEQLCYTGLLTLAKHNGLRLEGVALDREGLCPEALDAACQSSPAKFLYCVPTYQNPTTAVMSEARRREIVAVARKHDLTILEDDVFGLLYDKPPTSLRALAPERVLFLTSVSKTIAPALRVGYLTGPADLISRLGAALRAISWMAPPLTVELASRWIEDGTAEQVLEDRRRETNARLALASEILGPNMPETPAGSMSIWLTLPEPWRSADFTAEAQRRGVIVSPAEACIVGRQTLAHAVKVSLGPPRQRERLAEGLSRLRRILDDGPRDAFTNAL